MNIQIFGKNKCFDTKKSTALVQGARHQIPDDRPCAEGHEQG